MPHSKNCRLQQQEECRQYRYVQQRLWHQSSISRDRTKLRGSANLSVTPAIGGAWRILQMKSLARILTLLRTSLQSQDSGIGSFFAQNKVTTAQTVAETYQTNIVLAQQCLAKSMQKENKHVHCKGGSD